MSPFCAVFVVVLCITGVLTTSIQKVTPNNGINSNIKMENISDSLVYSQDIGYKLVMMSYSAYCPVKAIVAWNCYWCTHSDVTKGAVVTATIDDGSDNIFGFVAYIDKSIYVVFRGTQFYSIKDWVDDINFGMLEEYPKYPKVKVHGGFYNSYAGVRDRFRAALVSVLKTVPKPDFLYITGHSLGAALSAFFALDVVEDNLIPKGLPYAVVNFGQPRLGNPDFAAYYRSYVTTAIRVINNGDMVPHLPTELMGFEHSPTEVWYTSPHDFKVCNTVNGEDSKCSDSVLLPNIVDHLTYLGDVLVPCAV